jgi:hypothetical protein
MIDTLIAAMLVAVLALVLLYHRGQQRTLARHQQVQKAMIRLQEQMLFHTALDETPKSSAGFVKEVSPSWFAEGVPVNALVPQAQPWLDLAPEGDAHDNPPDPVITRPDQAGFWYTPARGLFRARIMPQHTDRGTVDLYNALNGTRLASLARPDDAEERTPVAMAMKQPITLPEAQPKAAPPKPPTLRDAAVK